MRQIFKLLSNAAKVFTAAFAPMHAAALAFYTIFSLAPLVVLAIAIAGFFVGRAAAESEFVALFQSVLGPESAEFVLGIATSLVEQSINTTYTIIAIGVLLVGATVVFSQLKLSLDAIWGFVPTKGSLTAGVLDTLRRRSLAVVMIFLAAGALILSVLLEVILANASSRLVLWFPGIARFESYLIWLITPIVGFLTFVIVFKLLPEARPRWREVIVGAALSAVLFTVGAVGVRVFLTLSGSTSVYGAAGALIAVLLWVYYSSWIVLYGAAFTRVYGEHLASPTPEPISQQTTT